MDRIVRKYIQHSVDWAKEEIENLRELIEEQQSIIDQIDNCSLIHHICPICGNNVKDLSNIIQDYEEIQIIHNGGSNSLQEYLIFQEGDGEFVVDQEYCSICDCHPIDNVDIEKVIRTWDIDLNPPGKKTKAWRIFEKYPQIDELSFQGWRGWWAKIGDKWYATKFSNV